MTDDDSYWSYDTEILPSSDPWSSWETEFKPWYFIFVLSVVDYPSKFGSPGVSAASFVKSVVPNVYHEKKTLANLIPTTAAAQRKNNPYGSRGRRICIPCRKRKGMVRLIFPYCSLM
jgi:hypothetical protein